MRNDAEKSFSVDLPMDLIEQFNEQIAKDGFMKKKAIISGLMRLFLAMPLDAQVMIASGRSDSGQELVDLVREIAQGVYDKGKKKGRR